MNWTRQKAILRISKMDLRRLRFIGMTYSRLRNIAFLLRKGKFKTAYSYLWSTIFTRDSGIALLDSLWRLFPYLSPYPEAIEIEPTTRCHLRCVICEHTYWKEAPRDMSFEEFKIIINQFPRLKWAGMTGIGSQFLNKDFIRMLKYLKDRNVYIEFFDSFDLINKDIASELISLTIDKMWFSCDAASKETYEKIRIGARFDNVMKNVQYFLQLKKQNKAFLPELWFHYIINKYNVEEMPAYVDMVAELVKDVPNSATLIFFTGLMEFPEVMPIKVWQVPSEIKKDVYERLHKHGIYVLWNENIARNQLPGKCTKWTEPFVLATGHIQPCCVINEANERDFQKENAFMNLLEDNFCNFWHSQKFKGFLRTLHANRLPGVCKNCKVYKMLQ